jgi:hypothetical protein
LKKNLSSCYSVKQKFHSGCPGIYNNLWKLKCFTVLLENYEYHAKSLLRKFCNK